jgi:hypothetical protein
MEDHPKCEQKGITVAEETPERSAADSPDDANQNTRDEEQRLAEMMNAERQRLNMLRTNILNRPPASDTDSDPES